MNLRPHAHHFVYSLPPEIERASTGRALREHMKNG